MKKIILLLILCVQVTVQATLIDRQSAKEIACAFLHSKCEETSIPSYSRDIQPDFYIFNSCDSTGFVILSANDCAQGILAFSFDGYFDTNEIPANCRTLLESYSNGIKRAAKCKVRSKFRAPEKGTKGIRIVTPSWNQTGHPYDALTPANAPAGCVPAAMGIVAKAWCWPLRGEGTTTHSGTVIDGDAQIHFKFEIDHDTDFAIERLPLTHEAGKTPLDIEDSLAKFMLHLSISVNPEYKPDGSSAYLRDARNALIDHFKFDSSATYDYSAASGIYDYAPIIRQEINDSRPVICGIPSHAIVCDGIWDDYFHFNFGWGGNANGYYLLSPSADDTALVITDMIYGIKPDSSRSDYTPRAVEVVSDEAPSESEHPEEIKISDKYSPIEFYSDGGKWSGLVSPFDNYKKGANVYVYASGLKLTGRFDGSTETLNKTDWQPFKVALGIVDKDENIRAVYPHYSSISVNYQFTTSNLYSLELTPDIDIVPTDKIVLLMRGNAESDWKIVKGLSDISCEVNPTKPSSEYLPFSLKYNQNDFRISYPWRQLENKVVKGQRYTIYLYPLKDMSSIDVKFNGKGSEFEKYTESDGTVYYSIARELLYDVNYDLSVEALSSAQTNVSVTLTEPGTLAQKLNGNENQIRKLTVKGHMNAIDLRHISQDLFPMLASIDLSDAEISQYLSIFPSASLTEKLLYNHSRIEEVKLPRELTQIKNGAFGACWRLKRITIPEGITRIPEQALGGNAYTEVVNFSSTPQSIYEYFVSRLNSQSTLLVPLGAKPTYERHPLWSRFAQINEFDPAGIQNVSIDNNTHDIKVYFTPSGQLIIEGLQHITPVKIYDFTGKLIWSGSSDNINSVSYRGLCIVLVGDTAFKLI